MMAATLAKGETVLENAAREPEIVNLAECLNAMGAKIRAPARRRSPSRASTLSRRAPPRGPRPHRDRHLCHGRRHDRRRRAAGRRAPTCCRNALDVLKRPAPRSPRQFEASACAATARHRPVDVTTEPFPGFPTDLQAQFMGLMTRAKGKSHITETIFENRFMHVQELPASARHITLAGQTAIVEGVRS
jgi:UDP-N-acetylglucosamine 1-carboxyvinyltransferase